MKSSLTRAYRLMRFGRPIIVVSGLPRSGTSMAMGMLEAGGVELVTDSVRTADESNPRGYYEYERVKELDKDLDKSWLSAARGKAIKIISFLLPYLPEGSNYRVVFMRRELADIVTSQNAMLTARGESTGAMAGDRVSAEYREHLRRIESLLARRPCFQVLEVSYGDVVNRPREEAERIATFLGCALDVSRMATAVDRTLHHHHR